MSDNRLITEDVERAAREGGLIHDGTARTIAAGWHGAGNDAFTAFSHTGTITPSLIDEIKREIAYVQACPHHFDATVDDDDLGTAEQNIRALHALGDYVENYGERGSVEGWSDTWVGRD